MNDENNEDKGFFEKLFNKNNQTMEEDAKKKQEEVKNNIKSFKAKSDIKIKPEGVNTVNIKNVVTKPYINTTKNFNDYNVLLKDKVKDEILKKDVILHRKLLLQHRIFCDIIFHSKTGVLASIKVFGCLLEHESIFNEYWLGQVIDPTNFSGQVLAFESQMRQFGIKAVSIVQHPTKVDTVQNVELIFSFS